MSDLPMIAVLLVGAHCIADYPLQGDFLAKAKNHTLPIPGVPYWQALSAHAAIHGAMVAVITGIWWMFALEFAAHWAIDRAKCAGRLSFNQDQALHIICKAAWIIILVSLGDGR